MRSTRSPWPAAISLGLLGLFWICSTDAAKRPRYGGTLRIELHGPVSSLDPREWKPGSVASIQSERLAGLIFDRLVTLDDYGRFQPALAREWSHDARAENWQFKLRTVAKFSDGSPLRPQDVVRSLQALLPSGLQVEASEGGITVRAEHPYPELLEQLSAGRFFVFRIQPDGKLLGTGPFFLAESSPPTPSPSNPAVLGPARMRFRANEEAWSGRPFVDAVEISFGAPPLRQILDLQVGRTDLIDIPIDLVRKARQENLRLGSSAPRTLLALRFDEVQPAARDRNLREALDLALDRTTMANVLLQREALPAYALLPQWLSGYAFLFGTPMNLARAQKLRSALSGRSNGPTEPLLLRVDAAGELMKILGERVVVNARQANLAVQLVSHTSAASPSAPTAPVGLHLFAWNYDSLSPRAELKALADHFGPAAHSGSAWESPDPERLYQAERLLLEDRSILPLILLPDFCGIAPRVQNWTASRVGEWRLADVWLETPEPSSNEDLPRPTGFIADPSPGVRP